ncbi:hypothetical protein C8R41DRAFT_838588 [Lentinula lateritia]|uniref:Uncharacterized protein n=1 Tax=Lentinula lateritia TaxID=40482 RepID=A0ABQ8VDE3_9AGAR|nr:hypothetical protein C8R41DRAFT_838588 [Lentinula lateritia]
MISYCKVSQSCSSNHRSAAYVNIERWLARQGEIILRWWHGAPILAFVVFDQSIIKAFMGKHILVLKPIRDVTALQMDIRIHS